MTNDPPEKTFAALERASGVSADCLRVAAFLPGVTIPAEFFRIGAPALGPSISQAFNGASDDAAVEDALQPINETLLCERVVEYERLQGWRINSAGEEVIKSSMDEAALRQWAERIIRGADLYFRANNSRWIFKEIPLKCAELIKRWEMDFVETGQPLLAIAEVLSFDKPKEAEIYLKRALQLFEKNLGPNHLDVATASYELGKQQYRILMRSDEPPDAAILHIRRAMEIRLKLLPVSDPIALDNACTLAEVYLENKNAEAAFWVGHVASTIKQMPKAGSRLRARAEHNRAYLFFLRGEYQEAMDIAKGSLKIWKSLKDEEYDEKDLDDLLHSVNSGGGETYSLLSEISRALDLDEETGRYLARSLALPLKSIGIEPTKWGDWLTDYAGRDDDKRLRVPARRAMYSEAITIVEEELGRNHPAILSALFHFAGLTAVLDGYERAEPHFNRAVEVAERAGDRDEMLANILEVWGRTSYFAGKYVEAELHCERALAILDKQRAPSESQLIALLDIFALVKRKLRQPREADALEARAERLRKNNPDIPRLTAGKAFALKTGDVAVNVGVAAFNVVGFIFKLIFFVVGLLILFFNLRSCFSSD